MGRVVKAADVRVLRTRIVETRDSERGRVYPRLGGGFLPLGGEDRSRLEQRRAKRRGFGDGGFFPRRGVVALAPAPLQREPRLRLRRLQGRDLGIMCRDAATPAEESSMTGFPGVLRSRERRRGRRVDA